ncbi:hypothetical protein Tco_1280081, partial [Tanacetum coccineum]
VDKFTFPADFVVVNYDVDPRVPLILGRPFLRTARTLFDVYGEELTLRKSIHPLSGSLTPSSDPVVVSLSPSLTPFGDSDFLLEETDAFLALDDSIPPEIDNGIYDSEGDILFLKKILNDDPTKDLPPKELKNNETKTTKSSIKEPPELEFKDLPPHLEYAGINPNFCTHKILMEDNFKPAVQHQRRVNPKIHEVIKAEVIKLLDAGLIYPISDSPWVSLVHVVPKKGGMTVVTNGISKFLSIPKTKKKPPSPALMGLLLTVGCLSVFAMPQELFKEGIVLGHKISKNGIEVDQAKVDVIAKLPPPTMVKGIRSFLGHAGIYRRFIQDFSKIARPMTYLLEKETPFVFSKECME